MDITRPFLTTRQASFYLGLSKRQLERMRWLGAGPSYRRHGHNIFYHIDDVNAWSLASVVPGSSIHSASREEVHHA